MEGVRKFRSDHTFGPLDVAGHDAFAALKGWRDLLFRAGLIGIDPARYGGVGFGNVSLRIDADAFLVSGTQTSIHAAATPDHFAVVTAWDLAENRVVSRGPAEPSSESMTHAMLYACRPDTQCVLHVHSPEIWTRSAELGLADTPPEADYGTPEMAVAVRELQAEGTLDAGIFAMRGHEDGIVAFAPTAEEAAQILLRAFAAALS